MEAALYPIVVNINTYLSNYILVFLLIGVGLWYSINTRFVQVRCFGEGIKKVFGNLSLSGGKQEHGMSSFQALATAIAAQVGTGNIVGASGAILAGGPGAIFWMWIIAFFGMATIYAEATLAIKTRRKDPDGSYHGGPVYYITTAFQGAFGKFLAGFFAVAIILALGFMGCMVQSNSIGSTFQTAFGVPSWIVGIVLVVICGLIFVGGVQRLAAVTEKLVPIMAVIFLVGGLAVLVVRFLHPRYLCHDLPLCLPAPGHHRRRLRLRPEGGHQPGCQAWPVLQRGRHGLHPPRPRSGQREGSPRPGCGGHGRRVYRHLYRPDPQRAGSYLYPVHPRRHLWPIGYVGEPAETLNKTNLAQTAFGTVFGTQAGAMFVAICLFFFAFSTVLSWNMFGKINVIYLFGKKAAPVYAVIALVFIFLGTLMSNDLVWELTDMFNNLMVIPNAIALFALTGTVVNICHMSKKTAK